jgi:pimeloyl-ACP methyl ester carboxylesterase
LISFHTASDHRLAYEKLAGQALGLVFLGGYASDMTGTKASFLAARCDAENRAFLRFDYRGHGQSSGEFKDCSIGDWFADSLAVFDALTEGKQILVGSSMGGWLALKLALARPDRVAGIIGIAAAPDFTEDLIWQNLSAADRLRLEQDGYITDPESGLIYTKHLLIEARAHLLLRAPIGLTCPVHLLQGQQDQAVPWQTAEHISAKLTGTKTTITLIPDGDHRLSRPEDCELLWQSVKNLCL